MNQSEKLKTLDSFLHPCTKEGAKLPDSGHSPRTREHSGSQPSPTEQEAAGYGNFPWQPDMPRTKAGELNCVLPLLSFGPAPKASLCRIGQRKPTTQMNKGLGDSPGFGLLPLPLAADSSLKTSPESFPLILCPKPSILRGLHTIRRPWSQPLPLHHPADHSGRERPYRSSWETERKGNRRSDTHHLLNTVFWYSPANPARCRSWPLTEMGYLKI